MKTFDRLALAAWLGLAAMATALKSGLLSWGRVEAVHLCLFRYWWGARCPGCGMGHSLLEAFQGHWTASWRHHPLGLPLLAVWTAWLAFGLLNRGRGMDFSRGWPALRPVAGIVVLILILAAHLWRIL
ncbi:MAG TPA: hypothetical protein DEB40_03185 [Elusimicrobia bacterium]|nr:hypothetical protein [Elusimicrobiota bacterium]HBT60735.1 hypothetical protein [Elusimicrobiota bacterium]